jgi:hypothetical protein
MKLVLLIGFWSMKNLLNVGTEPLLIQFENLRYIMENMMLVETRMTFNYKLQIICGGLCKIN